MKSIALALSLTCLCAIAQPAGDSKPASTNVMGAEFPKIDGEGRATFQLKAPDASKIQADIGGKKYDMIRDAQGMWSGSTPPLVPGLPACLYRALRSCA